MTDENGVVHTGLPIQVSDVQNLFEYFPILGGMKDEPLKPRTELTAGDELSGLVAARFKIPKHQLDARESLVLRLYNANGRFVEVSEGE